MLQVWKIEVPTSSAKDTAFHGWALATTAEEALMLSGVRFANVIPKPDHLWIFPRKVVWEN